MASSLMDEGFRLPISRRGLFFKDDFFSGFQDDYKTAVGDVLDRWRSRSSAADRFASYKKLRERDASDDNQAATISETPDNYVVSQGAMLPSRRERERERDACLCNKPPIQS